MQGDRYKEATIVFCDGFEIAVGALEKAAASKHIAELRDIIQNEHVDKSIKNLLLLSRHGISYIWVTLAQDSAFVSDRTLP